MDLTTLFAGKKTYLAAAGLVVTAIVQFSAKDYVGAAQSVFAALSAFGLRAALEARLGIKLPDVAVTPPAPAAPQVAAH
jgi:hypothetical protein